MNKAYSHPLRRAECSSLRLVTLTCTSTDATDTAALARITPSAGKAKPGAYAAICATYAREKHRGQTRGQDDVLQHARQRLDTREACGQIARCVRAR